ncbi:MAG TPA: acyl-CoA dehydrogenase, partial [Gemmataceae bacterium]|nr:acyl-CoA dehydrogenase [Gemmataceae bacterium]
HLTVPEIPVKSPTLQNEAKNLGKRIRDFGVAVVNVLGKYREAILERQYVQERVAEMACDLYACSCALSRLDHILSLGNHQPAEVHRDIVAGKYFLQIADRRIRQHLAAITDNDDAMTTPTANAVLESFKN